MIILIPIFSDLVRINDEGYETSGSLTAKHKIDAQQMVSLLVKILTRIRMWFLDIRELSFRFC